MGTIDIVISILKVNLQDKAIFDGRLRGNCCRCCVDYSLATPSNFDAKLIWTEDRDSVVCYENCQAFRGETNKDITNCYGPHPALFFICGMKSCGKEKWAELGGNLTAVHGIDEVC